MTDKTANAADATSTSKTYTLTLTETEFNILGDLTAAASLQGVVAIMRGNEEAKSERGRFVLNTLSDILGKFNSLDDID